MQPKPDVLLRTRRSVMEAAHELRAQRDRQRKQMGIALLVLGVLVLLITPALWGAVSDLTAGERFSDMPMMLAVLSVVLLSAIFAVLLVNWRSRAKSMHDEQR